MKRIVDKVYGIDGIGSLAEYLLSVEDQDGLRNALMQEFMTCCNYSTPQQWNRAVRLCESLAVVGWGDCEAVEAHAGKYFNGYPNTFFVAADGKVKYLDAVWCRCNGGIMIDPDRSMLNDMPEQQISPVVCDNVKLMSQRNWIAKSPVKIVRVIGNCYPGSRAVLESIDEVLNPMLCKEMRPLTYGSAINRIYINCSMSFYDDEHCKTNYIIADESLRLKKSEYYGKLLEMYGIDEIERDGLYLRPRYQIGPFRRETGNIYATIVFERSFSNLPPREQKRIMSEYFVNVIRMTARRQKNLDYDFSLMSEDFRKILTAWTGM